jgi:hypothetical protein
MASSGETGLQRNAVGLSPVLFMSVTTMAPGAAVAFSILFAVRDRPRIAETRRVFTEEEPLPHGDARLNR